MEFPFVKIPFAPDRWTIHRPPDFVYGQGSPEALGLLDLLPARGLAVVGTRRPQPRAEVLVRNTIAALTESRVVILSGLALGIDACAHEAAMEAGLPTIAILGCGLGCQYPLENAGLRKRILESGGLILSEYEADQRAQPHSFLDRNRLIAGFAQATWIVQAPARSGALNTACHARENDRDCYATPSFPGDPALAGNQRLIDEEHAAPLWGAHSLGKTWLELSNAGKIKRPDGPPEDALSEQIRCHTARSGGVTLGDLLDWAIAQGMTPIECFERLQKAQRLGHLSEKNGVFAANEISL